MEAYEKLGDRNARTPQIKKIGRAHD